MISRGVCLPHQLFYPPLDARDRAGPVARASYGAYLEGPGEPCAARDVILYVHVPFCSFICEFCTFDKTNVDLKARSGIYLEHLRAEIDRYASTTYGSRSRVVGLHIGGGTPSILSPPEIRRLVGDVKSAFRFAHDAPVDIEVALPTVNEEKLAAYAELGVRKISFGVQTFDPALRAAMNLPGETKRIERSIRQMRDLGFAVYFDLMYGLPDQDVQAMCVDVQQAIDLEPDGIEHSQYYPYGSRWWTEGGRGDARFPSGETLTRALVDLWQELPRHGYEQKSAYMFCRRFDNMLDFTYHGNPASSEAPVDCIGLGSSAYGFVGPFHYRNLWQEDYVRHSRPDEFPLVHLARSGNEEIEDRKVILFPRVLALAKATVASSTLERFRAKVDVLKEHQLVLENADTLWLTLEGRARFNDVMFELMPESQRGRIDSKIWRLG